MTSPLGREWHQEVSQMPAPAYAGQEFSQTVSRITNIHEPAGSIAHRQSFQRGRETLVDRIAVTITPLIEKALIFG